MPPTKEITENLVIVGEGAGDAAFFTYLCQVHNLLGFQSLDAGGVTKFERFLKDLPSMTGFRKQCKLLLVVGDNDDGVDDAFKFVRTSIKKAKLPCPDNPLQIVQHTTDDLRVAVMMIPFDATGRKRGCLETLLLQSAVEHRPEIANCLPAFSTCIGVESWPNRSHGDKFRLRAFLAAAFRDDPNFGLQYALNPEHDVIPLTHECFNGIVEFLRTLAVQT